MAVFVAVAGKVANQLLVQGWCAFAVRCLMMAICFLGPALCFVLLLGVSTVPNALLVLMAMLTTHAFSVAGFHAHIQDVAPSRAGTVSGITNTVGNIATLIFTRMTGWLVTTTGSFHSVFIICAIVNLGGALVFLGCVSGQQLPTQLKG